MQSDARQGVRENREQGVRENREQDIKTGKEIKDLVKGFIGRDVSVALRGKKSLKGRLESATQYELLLTISHEPVIIMKHAIDYVELVK